MSFVLPDTHLRFLRGVRGALVAEPLLDAIAPREQSWDDVRHAWAQPRHSGLPTPWDTIMGKASATSGGPADRPTTARVQRPLPPSRLRVFLDDDRYYYDLAPGHGTMPLVREGPVTWRYVGQAIFSASVSRKVGRWKPTSLGSGGYDRDLEPGQLLRPGVTRKADSLGRLWVLHELDREALQARLEAYDARANEPLGDRYPGEGYAPYLLGDEGGYFAMPVGYTTTYCTGSDPASFWDVLFGDFTRFVANHSKDPLSKSGRPFNNRAEKFVILGGATGCSGTIMDGDDILTAAHCVTDEDLDLLDATAIGVCTYANDGCGGSSCSVPSGRAVDCAGGDSVILIGPYSGSLDSEDDLAVLRLQSRLGEVDSGLIDTMYLSKRKSSLVDFAANTRGYPGGTPDSSSDVCDDNTLSSAFSSADGASTRAAAQYFATGTVDAVLSSTINFILSSASGMSGGAMYYCWTDCEDGHGQTSLQSLYTGLSLNGPRSADFRSSVLAVI